MREAASDLGIKPEKDFQGRNGPVATQRIIDHAIDINEARNKSYIDPIRSTEVAPDFLTKNPDLAARFTPEQIKKGITYGDIDNERIQMNKELRRSGLYSQDLSKQYATQLESLERAAGQARDSVYGEVGRVTGNDLRASKQIESSLIKVADTAETTKNTLAQQEAKYQNTPMTQRIRGEAKRLISLKANPTNAFEPGVSSPTDEFNRNMRNAFGGVEAAPGSIIKNGKLTQAGPAVLTPSNGVTPPEPGRQLQLPLVPGEHGFDLTPPPGNAPPAPAEQYGIPGFGRGGADMSVPPQPELPGPLRPAAGLSERRSIPRSMTMSQSDLEAAIKNRKPITTPFDDTAGARETMNRDINMPKPPGGGVRTGNSPGSISAEEANRPGTNYLVKRDGSLTAQSKSYAPEETKPGQAHVTLMSNGDYRVNAGDLTPQMEKGLRSGTKAKNRIY
jgi:hypothetical protein